MSLAIIITTNEGNIIAADSMETYRNAIGDVREGSLSRMKLFHLNNRVGATSCGLAFLENKNIHQLIIQLKKEAQLEGKTVKEIAEIMFDFFYPKYQEYIQGTAEKKKADFIAQGFSDVSYTIELEVIKFSYKNTENKKEEKESSMPIMEFLVAGNDPDGINYVYKITIPDKKEKNGIVLKTAKKQCGATWIGQTDVLVRLIRGWSPEIKNLKAINDLPENRHVEVIKEIDDQEYLINWGTMTIQDAVEFANLAIKTTESIQKITDGTWKSPGSSPGVGGPVDIAITTPEKGFVWIQKKKIEVNGGDVLDLDSVPNLPTTQS